MQLLATTHEERQLIERDLATKELLCCCVCKFLSMFTAPNISSRQGCIEDPEMVPYLPFRYVGGSKTGLYGVYSTDAMCSLGGSAFFVLQAVGVSRSVG